MPPPEMAFTPSPDVRLLLNELLDRLERRQAAAPTTAGEEQSMRSVKVRLNEIELPGYYSQIDPEPRQVANEQLQTLEQAGLLRLFWQTGEKGHLLEAVAINSLTEKIYSEYTLFNLISRVPTANLRGRLENLLLGERFRFSIEDWQYRAIHQILAKLKESQSPAPFLLNDPVYNEDLLLALAAVSELREETPFRVFSVRVYNDSKRFEDLKRALVRLARLGCAGWKRLPEDELLRELNLVANPTYLLLSGPWTLIDAAGQILALREFYPSVGLAAVHAAHLARVHVHAERVICVENLTTFHAIASDARMNKSALLCLSGNPSPVCRRLLQRLVYSLPDAIPLYVWADMDFGGFNILAQLRREVSPRFMPYCMDTETLDRHAQFARPLTVADRRNLERLAGNASLTDIRPVIEHLIRRGLKLEQEAIVV